MAAYRRTQVKFAAWPTSWRPPGAGPHSSSHSRDLSEFSKWLCHRW